MKTRDLTNKRVMITGAASGIGRATAELCAERGAELILSDIDGPKLQILDDQLKANGVLVHTDQLNIASRTEVETYASKILSEIGPPHLLINNAGVLVMGNFSEIPLEDWDWVIDINLKGTVHMCKGFLEAMIDGGGGHIVNVSSIAGVHGFPSASAYGATKHAIIGLSESIRVEARPLGVSVSALCPGLVKTGILDGARVNGGPEASRRLQTAQKGLAKHGSRPETIAEAILDAAHYDRAIATVSGGALFILLLKRLCPPAMRWVVAQERKKSLR